MHSNYLFDAEGEDTTLPTLVIKLNREYEDSYVRCIKYAPEFNVHKVIYGVCVEAIPSLREPKKFYGGCSIAKDPGHSPNAAQSAFLLFNSVPTAFNHPLSF